MVKTSVIGLRVIEGPDARDQIAFCAFHSFLVIWNACVITTWRLGLQAPFVARNNNNNNHGDNNNKCNNGTTTTNNNINDNDNDNNITISLKASCRN